jgi:hypothetical protein
MKTKKSVKKTKGVENAAHANGTHANGTTYKVEILTADKAGLAALLLNLKRAKVRRMRPFGAFALEWARREKKEATERDYSAFIDKSVGVWDGQTRDNVKAQVEERRRADEKTYGTFGAAMGGMVDGDEKADEKIHTIRTYIGALNRDVNINRVQGYRNTMWQKEWWFTPDPVVVTDEGDIINGQHRLLAAEEAEIEGPDAPKFVVVWGVDKRVAILVDEARRTANDRRDIALRYAAATGR